MISECRVSSIENLNQQVFRVLLEPIEKINFKAGQYLKIHLSETDQRPFSIASCSTDKYLELHIGGSEKSRYSSEVIDRLEKAKRNNKTINVDMPHGEGWLRRQSHRPLLFIAGGTGYSYIDSLLKECLLTENIRPIKLYWGVRKFEDLYEHNRLIRLSRHYQQLSYIPVVETAPDSWAGKTGLLMDFVYNDFQSLDTFDIYLCGRFEMVKKACDFMVKSKGANLEHMYGDAI